VEQEQLGELVQREVLEELGQLEIRGLLVTLEELVEQEQLGELVQRVIPAEQDQLVTQVQQVIPEEREQREVPEELGQLEIRG
jgi:Trp operon repressor